MHQPGRQFLHTPGPSAIPDRVLNAMHRQPLDLSDPQLAEIVQSCLDDLKLAFATAGDVFIYAANGHGGWEAALSNIFAPGETALVPETGYFSESWASHARMLGIDTQIMPGDIRRAIDPDRLEATLRGDGAGRIKAVLVVHADTATGVASDIRALRAAIDAARHPALLVADVVASLGAAPFRMDEWGVDVAIGASQKALMGPPGLAFIAANPRARAAAVSVSRPRHYWDWEYRAGVEGYRRFCGTAPEHGLFALQAALNMLREEGLVAVQHRHARLARAVWRAVEAWGVAGDLCVNALRPDERSTSVTTILTPSGFDSGRIREHARECRGVALGGGLGALAGRAFRIGHLGDLNEPMILGCLAAVELTLRDLGLRCGRDGLPAAIESLASSGSPPGAPKTPRPVAVPA
ncbi:MAG: aminotransferase class V-fold PLP-dependent enzyme [Bosea sp.]|nr:aminotransferase class V-fold PLP-dependent enzyme [Bosea sp. (in: a-proteobacteria)]